MSLTTVPPARGSAMPAAPSSAPTPRALIDYDFQTVLRVPPKRRLVLWLMVGLIVAAAIAVAGWLGFAMGSDASLALSEPRQPSDASFLPELFDPTTGFLRDLGEGMRT